MAELKLTDKIVTTTYEVSGHPEFFIDIVENRHRHVWDAYLWHMYYGVKAHIFGSDTEALPLEGFKQVMMSGIEYDIKAYIEEYAPELSAENAIELLYADFDEEREKRENQDHGKLLECRQEAYREVYVYEDGYKEYRVICG